MYLFGQFVGYQYVVFGLLNYVQFVCIECCQLGGIDIDVMNFVVVFEVLCLIGIGFVECLVIQKFLYLGFVFMLDLCLFGCFLFGLFVFGCFSLGVYGICVCQVDFCLIMWVFVSGFVVFCFCFVCVLMCWFVM